MSSSKLLSDDEFLGGGSASSSSDLLTDDEFMSAEPVDRSVTLGSVARGFNRLQQSGNVLLNEAGLISDESAAKAIARDEEDIKRYPTSPTVKQGLKDIADAEGWGDTIWTILKNPSTVASVVGESLPMSAAAQVAGSVAGAGGSLAGPAGTTAGIVAGTGAASFATEYSSTILDTMQAHGVDLNDPKAVGKAFRDDKLMAEARERGLKRGIPIAAFDALSFGIAGKFAKAVEGGAETISTLRRGLAEAAEVGAQGAAGASGEASAQIADKGKIVSAADVLMEGVAEVAASPAEIAIGQTRNSEQPSAQAGADVAGRPAAQPSQDLRLESPRLTPADRASPLPNDLIDDGKKIFEDALGTKAIDVPTSDIATPSMRAEADRRAADIAAPASQPAPSAIEHTIDGALTPAETGTAPAGLPAGLLTDDQFLTAGETNPEPTQAQAEAGNYAKRHVKVHGLDVSIENEAGSVRRGTDADGKPWETILPAAYGYIKRSTGADGDQLDVYLGPRHTNNVYVIDQIDPATGKFDEHKIMIGFGTGLEALNNYEAAFSDGKGKERIGSTTPMTMDQFKDWLKNGKTKEPLNYRQTIDLKASAPEPAAQAALKQKIKAKRERAPLDLIQFLAADGGIVDHKGEIKSLGMKGHFVPGVGKLMRATGMDLDRAREKAEEAGYIGKAGDYQTTTVADLLDALDKNMRGQRVYAREDAGRAENRAAEKAVKTNSEEQARQDDFDQMVKEFDLNDEETAQIQAAVERGEWASEAIVDILERRAIASESKTRKSRTQKEPDFDAPFDLAAEDRAGEEAADASRGRKGSDAGRAQRPAPAVEQPAQAERSGRAEEGGKGESALATEPGAEGKPQTVIPGAERISQKQEAERAAAKPMRGKVEQKPAGGLFSDDSKQTDLLDLARNPAPKPVAPVASRSAPASSKIDDFGEKIEGARKDMVRDFANSLSADIDITTEPLSKIFPQPDYEKLAEAGVNRASLAMIAVARQQIPSKPRVNYKVKRWAEQVRVLRDFANKLMTGEYSDPEAIAQGMRATAYLRNVADTAKVIETLDPAMLPAAAKWQVRSASYSAFRKQNFNPPKTLYTLLDDNGRYVTVDGDILHADTLAGLLEPARTYLREKLGAGTESATKRQTPTGIYQDRTTKTFFIGFKGQSGVIRLKAGFETANDARSYREEKGDELQAAIDEMRAGPQMRRPENRPREGVERREGDVSPEQFQEAFGFRGVQFGNYVEEKRRQFELNEAFDGLMDLAEVIGVPPNALSLDGKLGLAFGARGHGNAKAHYEPTHVVINLTKTKGAGSLAHEWFHGVDDYFSRQDTGRSAASVDFMTTRGENDQGAARPAVKRAFAAVRQSLFGNYAKRMGELDAARSKPYWNTTIEKAARGFEKYVVDRLAAQKATNDYLANIDENAGAYPTNAEMRDQGITAAFDELFKAIETKPTERGTAMFKARPDTVQPTDAFREQAQAIGTRLRSELDRLGLKDVGLQISEKLGLMVAGKFHAADGRYFQKLIQIALDAENPDAVLDHEALHALRDVGAFTPAEWSILERKSRKQWMAEHEIADAYGQFPEWVQVEEGIAHAYAAWKAGAQTDGIIAKSFKKITAILKAIARVFGKDFRTAEDVFASVASGKIGSRPRSGAQMTAQEMAQAAWHGTPHDFDEFSLDAMGTGEGAQAFGWGLYFAGKKGIAEYYRDKLAGGPVLSYGGEAHSPQSLADEIADQVQKKVPLSATDFVSGKETYDHYISTLRVDVHRALQQVEDDDSNSTSARDAFDAQVADRMANYRPYDDELPSVEKMIAAIQAAMDQVTTKKQGKLFKVDLPEDSELMDWDKPFSEQSPQVQAAIRSMPNYERHKALVEGGGDMGTLYKNGLLPSSFTPQAASEALRAAGIPGHRYLDNTSRNAGEGTYNYVIYDDSRVKVQEKFALRRAATAPGQAPAQRRTTPAISILPNISTVASSVSTRIMNAIKGGPGKNDGESLGDYSMRKIVDYLHPLREMIESVGPVADRVNAYLEARLALDSAVASIQDMHGKFVTPAVEALTRAGASLDDLHRYLYALHAEERNRVVGLRNDPQSDFYKAVTDLNTVGASGWSTNHARQVLRQLRVDPAKFAGIQQAGRLVRQMLDENLLAQKNAGLISDASYNSLTQQWQNYVPLQAEDGIDENGDFSMPGRGRGFDVRGKEFKGATGRFSEAENIPAWAISASERSKLRQAKNRVGKSILRFINQYDPNGTNLAEVYWSDTPAGGFGNIQKAPPVYKRELDASGKVVNKAVPYSTIAPDMYAAKVAGKTFYIKFADEKVGQALKNMNAVQMHVLLRISRAVTNFQSLVNTRLSPEFVATNFFRDALTGLVHLKGFNAKETAKVFGDIPNAFAAVWRNARGRPGTGPMDQALAEMTKAGGRIIFEQQRTVEESIAALHKQMAAAAAGKGSPRALWEGFKKTVGDVNDTVEMGIRLSSYAGMRAKGMSVKQAALATRDLTVDFRKHGEAGPTANALYAFFNASVQGSFNVASRVVTSRRAQVFAGGLILAGFMLDMLNRSLSGDDDDGENIYEKMLRDEPWRFERQMVLFYGPGKDSYFSIPLAYGYNVFQYMGLQASSAAHGGAAPLEAISNTVRVALDAYNPMGGGEGWMNMFAPTIADPFVEIRNNENFAGHPLYPDQFRGDTTPDSQMQQFTKTPEFYRFIAEQMNDWTGGNAIEPGAVDIHPESIQHMLGFVTGGIGRLFSRVADPVMKAASGKSDEIEIDQLPFVRTFYGQWDEDNRRSEYYKLREAVQATDDRNEKYKDTKGDAALTGDFEDFKAAHKIEIDSIPAFDVAEKRLRKLRKTQRRLEAEGGKEAELKTNAEARKKAMDRARKEYADNAKALARQRQ